MTDYVYQSMHMAMPMAMGVWRLCLCYGPMAMPMAL